VSAATAALFNTYAAEYQAVVAQASSFHDTWSRCWPAPVLRSGDRDRQRGIERVGVLTAPLRSLLGGSASGASPAANSIIDLVLGASGYPIPWQIPAYITELPVIYLDQLWNAPNVFGTIIA